MTYKVYSRKIIILTKVTRKEVIKVESLQERMIRYRARERINQQELANRCGLSKQTINSIENDTQEPSKVTRAKIELVVGKE